MFLCGRGRNMNERSVTVTRVYGWACVSGLLLSVGVACAAETNVLSFAYTASLAPEAATPDPLARRLNDGLWTDSAAHGVRYAGDVTVTLDLGCRVLLSEVEARTFTAEEAGAWATAGVTLEAGTDGASWVALGGLSAEGGGVFKGSMFYACVRYLRVTCARQAGAAGQILGEIVVHGEAENALGLHAFSYTTSVPFFPGAHTDGSLNKLYDGLWTNASNQSVQYGPSNMETVDPDTPGYAIASNVTVTVDLGSEQTVSRAHLYAFRSNTSNGYVTARVILSNSLDGVSWNVAGEQEVYETFYANAVRFDFLLPNTEARYWAFVCLKGERTDVPRQLLGEIQLTGPSLQPVVGEPLLFTYTIAAQVAGFGEKTDQPPRLTDRTWDHVVENGVRVVGNTEILADLGVPRRLAGARLYVWGPTKYSSTNKWYGTRRVLIEASTDSQSWTEVADLTEKTGMYFDTVFTNKPFARYLRLSCEMCDDEPDKDFENQIFGELLIFQPQVSVIGAAPVEVAGAIPFAGFESDPLLDPALIVKGGTVNGWAFSYTDADHYAGYQINGSTVSGGSILPRYAAPEGSQTAVLMGVASMETQVTVPVDGCYGLRFEMINATLNDRYLKGPYDFRVLLDGVEVEVVMVMNQAYVQREVLLPRLSAGTHALRFDGLNSRQLTGWGVLIDRLRLLHYAMRAEQVAQQGAGMVFMADSWRPLALSYDGAIRVGALWVESVLQPTGKHGEATYPAVFSGPGGIIGFGRGTMIMLR